MKNTLIVIIYMITINVAIYMYKKKVNKLMKAIKVFLQFYF